MKAAPVGTATTGGIAVIKVDLTSISDFVSQEALDAMAPRVAEAHQTLEAGTSAPMANAAAMQHRQKHAAAAG